MWAACIWERLTHWREEKPRYKRPKKGKERRKERRAGRKEKEMVWKDEKKDRKENEEKMESEGKGGRGMKRSLQGRKETAEVPNCKRNENPNIIFSFSES